MTIQELEKTQEGSGQEAIRSMPSEDLNITAPGKLRVIKRNGKVVPFEEDKIKVAVTKAFLQMNLAMQLQVKGYTEKLKK
jgi:ribonucleoside-diphosphate reductase alpha chain